MTLNSLSIKIKNFKSIEQTDWILLDGKIEVLGKNLIDGGSNGSGKSSILEALYVTVYLCGMKDNSDFIKDLKKYCKDQKHPFEIRVKFYVQDKEFEILATPDGIKQGSIEAKSHLYKLIISFLMQGMSNSLIRQSASDCKTVISAYFECDLIIDNIIQNADIVKCKLENKIQCLRGQISNLENHIEKYVTSLETDEANLQHLYADKKEILGRVGSFEVIYNEENHAKLQIDIEKLDSEIIQLDDEIGGYYKAKAGLSNGVDVRIKELKRLRKKCVEECISLYSRTVGNKFVSFVKKEVKEFNDTQRKETAIKNEDAKAEKIRKIKELNDKLEAIRSRESSDQPISEIQRNSILSKSNKFIDVVSKKSLTVVSIREESGKLHNGILNVVKSKQDDLKEKLEIELNGVRKTPVKSFEEVEVTVFTVKNKPKKKLPKYYLVYNCDTLVNQHTLVENKTMIASELLESALNETDDYQPPNTSEFDREIAELEKTDVATRISFIDNNISAKQADKISKTDLVKRLRDEDRDFQDRKFKSVFFANDKIKLDAVKSDIATIIKEIKEHKIEILHFKNTLAVTQEKNARWDDFLAEILKDTRLVQNSFKDYIIDMYNDRIEPLITFYSNKVFSLNSKLLVRIGNKTKQPSLNGIKFDYTSGGEKSKAMFVFSLAHRDFLGKQRGFRNDYIFCDEVFDGMDETSRQQSIQFLTQAIYMKNILIISHMEEKSLPNFRKITILKSDNGSILEQSTTPLNDQAV